MLTAAEGGDIEAEGSNGMTSTLSSNATSTNNNSTTSSTNSNITPQY